MPQRKRANPQRSAAMRVSLSGELLLSAVCWAILLVLALGIVVAALTAPPAAASGTAYTPWQSTTAAGPLPYAHPQAVAAPPLLPGLPHVGSDLPYRHR
ncbi:hypothetical protein [Sinomonas terrae]|uniref:Uncharacterized protein n=1 Tax=Sinomonas terrae TaxID=2908838 RepID=A0ABS9U0M8_9MICC|nr:hypothetical protein [Sinomonas terrae]MCH6469870.1 hypothetical protein [Sinomonas terrae]